MTSNTKCNSMLRCYCFTGQPEVNSMVFPERNISNYVILEDAESTSLNAVTMCAWVKFVNNTDGQFLSYEYSSSNRNEFGLWSDEGDLTISVKSSWLRYCSPLYLCVRMGVNYFSLIPEPFLTNCLSTNCEVESR